MIGMCGFDIFVHCIVEVCVVYTFFKICSLCDSSSDLIRELFAVVFCSDGLLRG